MAKDKVYTVEVDPDAMVWGDASLTARFMLLNEEMGTIDQEDEAVQVAKMREMLELFEEQTEMLERVATVKCNGRRIETKKIPQSYIGDVMAAISDVQKASADPND